MQPSESEPVKKKQRRAYNCRQCGDPRKKGHSCPNPRTAPNQETALAAPDLNLSNAAPSTDLDLDTDIVPPGRFQAGCLGRVLRRLPPSKIVMAGTVCRGWRDTTRKMWKGVEELHLNDLKRPSFLLKKCPVLRRLSLRQIQSDFDLEILATVAFTCQHLEVLEISIPGAAVNKISGDELHRFVANKQMLTCLRMEGCSCLEKIVLPSSPNLSTLWLSGLSSVSEMSLDCCNLTELSLHFSHQEGDSTDLAKLVGDLGNTCPQLHTIQIVSSRLSDSVVCSLTAVPFCDLRSLMLFTGIDITDASVATISSCYKNLERLELSGITDAALLHISQHLPKTLSKLFVANCRKITSNGIQYATAHLPLLELMDCGVTLSDLIIDMTVSEPKSESNYLLDNATNEEEKSGNRNLYINHKLLKKLSLWGCSSLHILHLSCPELEDLNLNLCTNLQPEKLILNCPKLQIVYAAECHDQLTRAIREQVNKACVVELGEAAK